MRRVACNIKRERHIEAVHFIMHISWSSRKVSSILSFKMRQQAMHGRWCVCCSMNCAVLYTREGVLRLPLSWTLHLKEREITSVHTCSILNAFKSGPGILIYSLWQRAESAHGAQCQVGSREQEGGGESRGRGREVGDETWSECTSAKCETREAVENRYEQEGTQDKRKQIQITYHRFDTCYHKWPSQFKALKFQSLPTIYFVMFCHSIVNNMT